MQREQILQALYDMALVTSGEVHTEPLILKTLQRLLFHTAYPCGLFLSHIKEINSHQVSAHLEQVIGSAILMQQRHDLITLPKELLVKQSSLLDDATLITKAFRGDVSYSTGLNLVVSEQEQFLLLGLRAPNTANIFTYIFEPVLKNFDKMLNLTRENERYTQRLEEENKHRKELEESLRASHNFLQNILDHVPTRIYWKDTNSTYLGCNKLFSQDAGYTSSSEIIGKTDYDLPINKIYAEQYIKEDRSITQSMQAKIHEEECYLTAEGQEEWYDTSKIPLADSTGKIITLLGFYENITLRKQINKKIIEAKDEAERTNQAKSLFLSSMSHELRTPLNAILGFSQLLETEDDLSSDNKEDVQEIIKAGKHLLELINGILDLSAIEAGKIDLTIEKFPLNDVITECLALLKPLASQHNIHFNYKTNNDLVIEIKADRFRFKQVLLNLLSNAIKYNKENGDINISTLLYSHANWRVSIQDTGIGIPAEKIPELFNSFDRIGAEKSAIEGAGIGLVITKQLIELMQGVLIVESEYGVGSTFTVQIPKA